MGRFEGVGLACGAFPSVDVGEKIFGGENTVLQQMRTEAALARAHQGTDRSLAFLAGGETVVHLTGSGLGGRNQELALSAAAGIDGLRDTAVFSVGSDGTDGPTDAAGGFVTGETRRALAQKGVRIFQVLRDNDAYHALAACDGLLITGATGTNVNDVAVVLIRR